MLINVICLDETQLQEKTNEADHFRHSLTQERHVKSTHPLKLTIELDVNKSLPLWLQQTAQLARELEESRALVVELQQSLENLKSNMTEQIAMSERSMSSIHEH